MKDIPAFPVNPDINITLEPRWAGMTLRDYFAAMALQGWLASFSEEMEPHPRKTAEFCYVIADAMMDARDE